MEVEFRKITNEIDFKKEIKSLIKQSLFEAAQINVKDIKSGLDTSQGPRGAIKKVKASTARQKRKKGYPIKPLVASGKMRNSVKSKITKDGGNVEIGGKMGKIGQYHDKGSGHLPKREWFDIYPNTVRKLDRAFRKMLARLLRK